MATAKNPLEAPTLELYFDAPEFRLHPLARKIANLLINVWLVVVAVSSVTFFLSETTWLKSLGALLAFYFADRLIHYERARHSLDELPSAGRVNLFYYLTKGALSAIFRAEEATLFFGGRLPLHLANELFEEGDIKEALRRLDINISEFRDKLQEYLKASLGIKTKRNEALLEINNLVVLALSQAKIGQNKSISAGELFAAVSILENPEISKIFELFSIKAGDLEKVLVLGRFRKQFRWFKKLPSSLGGFASSVGVRHRFMNRAWTARPTPNLDRFSIDFTDMARVGKTGFMIGHEREYHELLDVLSRPNKPNALLVGDVGAGKDTIVGHLAYMITQDKVPAPLFDKRLVALDLGALLAGAEQAELQERVKIIFDEIFRAGNIILYIPDIHNLLRTASNKGLTISNTVMPIIISNDFPVIGNTYPLEYKKIIQTDSSFAEAFQVIRLEEISISEAEFVLSYDSLLLEEIYKVEISYGAIRAAVDLAHKYFRAKLLPSSADDLLKDALVDASHGGKKRLTADDVIAIAQRRINIPLKRAGPEEAAKLLNLESLIHERLIDQDLAVQVVSRALREYRSGLGRKGGPIGSFLFVGPTGVGKTELSKILAKIQFGSEQAMIRLDMSEYQDKKSIFRFIGSPDGEISGSLTEAVLEKPYALILLDEFEKAHPDILNLFLQVFDDGRLTDNFGRVVDFQNTIIIATSNAHSEFIKISIEAGRSMAELADELKRKLIDYFKPELLNRFSSVVVFKALSEEDVLAITRLQLKQFVNTLKENQDADIEFSEEAVKKLAALGYDPAFGARPLREVVSQKVRGPLAEKILKNEIKRGMKISVSLVGDNLEFEVT